MLSYIFQKRFTCLRFYYFTNYFLFYIFLDVHNAELILTGVLTQSLDYESYPFKMHTAFRK